MSVKIRLMRVGKKKQPAYRVVIADGRSPRDGRYLEIVGQYQPREEPSRFSVDDEKVLEWLRKGAQPTDQVHRLLVNAGIWERYESERSAQSLAARGAVARKKGADAARERSAADTAKAEAAAKAEEATAAAAAKADAAAKAEADAATAADAPAEDAPAEDAPAEDAGE